MKTYSYIDFIKLFQIKDRHKAEDKWFTFKVQKSGVTLIPQDELLTPTGGDLYSLEELYGQEEEIRWHPLVEIRAQKTSPPPAPEITLPPSRKNIEFIKKRIEQEIIIPPSQGMPPMWARGLGDLSKPLLPFPCNEEELRSFIEFSHMGFMFPPDHPLLQTHTEGTYQTEISDASLSKENRYEDSYSDYKVVGRRELMGHLEMKSWSGVLRRCKKYGIKINKTEDGKPYLMISAITLLNGKPRRVRKEQLVNP